MVLTHDNRIVNLTVLHGYIFICVFSIVAGVSKLFPCVVFCFFFSSRRRHTRWTGDWSSDVCSSDLIPETIRVADFDVAEKTATRIVSGIGATTAEGHTFRIDANLRPEGKKGPLARSLDGYRSYYDNWALTWEFQSLLKARPVAGDPEVAEQFCAMVEPYVFRDPFPAESIREVRRMKARVERERIPPGEDPLFHLKLGRGSLSDVEWTVQLLQLIHGAADPE